MNNGALPLGSNGNDDVAQAPPPAASTRTGRTGRAARGSARVARGSARSAAAAAAAPASASPASASAAAPPAGTSAAAVPSMGPHFLADGVTPANDLTVKVMTSRGVDKGFGQMPWLRNLVLNPAYLSKDVDLLLENVSYRPGMKAYIVGVPRAPCKKCAAGNGPFPACIAVPGNIHNACANCFYFRKGLECNKP